MSVHALFRKLLTYAPADQQPIQGRTRDQLSEVSWRFSLVGRVLVLHCTLVVGISNGRVIYLRILSSGRYKCRSLALIHVVYL